MKLDKIRFARLIGYISAISGRDFAPDEVDYIDRIADIEMQEAKIIGCNPDRLNDLLLLMKDGTRKIEAIKVYRDFTGVGLKESKDAIEAYWIPRAL